MVYKIVGLYTRVPMASNALGDKYRWIGMLHPYSSRRMMAPDFRFIYICDSNPLTHQRGWQVLNRWQNLREPSHADSGRSNAAEMAWWDWKIQTWTLVGWWTPPLHILNHPQHWYLWTYFDSVIMHNGNYSFKRYFLTTIVWHCAGLLKAGNMFKDIVCALKLPRGLIHGFPKNRYR